MDPVEPPPYPTYQPPPSETPERPPAPPRSGADDETRPRRSARDENGVGASWRQAFTSTARAGARAGSATRRTVRRATNAQGAGETGMSKLTELSGLNAAGDALVTVALAGTLFFSVPTDEARGRVALYLLITMVPFALLAPLVGPLLDRFRHGRRWAMATTFAVRAFLVWSMAGAISGADLWLYPAVFGVLVSGRAYQLAKAAGVPRLLPPNVPLVRANSWTNMAGLASAAVAAGAGIAITKVAGPEWTLRLTALVFLAGVVLSLRLPAGIDVAGGDRPASMSAEEAAESPKARARYVGPAVELGWRANMAFRALSGFLTLFLAFLLREHPIGDIDDAVLISMVIVAAGLGSVLGTSVGALLRERGPEPMLVVLLLLDTAAILAAALWYGLATVLAAGFVVGFAQNLGKLGLDALIQRDVEEHVRSSAFARSETRLQLAWVVGGAIGIALPLEGGIAFGIAGGAMLVLAFGTLRLARMQRLSRRHASGRRSGSRTGADEPAASPVPFPPTAVQRPD